MRDQWDIGTAQLTEYDEDGFIGVQVEPLADGGSAPFELHHSFGFAARPVDPETTGEGCSVLFWREGANGRSVHAWLASDPRYQAVVPVLKQGGSVQYGKTGTFRLIDGDDGSDLVYVPYEFVDGVATKAHAISVNTDTGSITIQHGEGQSIVLDTDGNIIMRDAGYENAITIGADGITIAGKKVTVYGPLQVGGAGGLPVLVGNPGSPTPSTSMVAS